MDRLKLVIPASRLNTEESQGVRVGNLEGTSPFGYAVLHNSQEDEIKSRRAVFDFKLSRAGYYRLYIEYASKCKRSCKVIFANQLMSSKTLSKNTGGWIECYQEWQDLGVAPVDVGHHQLIITAPFFLPHIRNVLIERVSLYYFLREQEQQAIQLLEV